MSAYEIAYIAILSVLVFGCVAMLVMMIGFIAFDAYARRYE